MTKEEQKIQRALGIIPEGSKLELCEISHLWFSYVKGRWRPCNRDWSVCNHREYNTIPQELLTACWYLKPPGNDLVVRIS